MPDSSKNAILIAGMHRTGTSALARTLNLLGADIGDRLLTASPDNTQGYWESGDVMQLNNEFFAHFGSSWHDLRPLPDGWVHAQWTVGWRARLRALIHRRWSQTDLFLVKDPRLAYLLPVWLLELRAMEITPSVILTLRDPDEAAASLSVRDIEPLPTTTARFLWMRHLLDAEHASRGVARGMVRYSRLLADWRSTADGLATQLGLEWPVKPDDATPEINKFLQPALQHQRSADRDTLCKDDVSILVSTLFRRIGDSSLDDAGLQVQLDQLRQYLHALATDQNPSQSPTAGDWPLTAAIPLLFRKAATPQPHEPDAPVASLRVQGDNGHYPAKDALPARLHELEAGLRADFTLPKDTCPTLRFYPATVPGYFSIQAIHLNGKELDSLDYELTAVHQRLEGRQDSSIVRIYSADAEPWLELNLSPSLRKESSEATLSFLFHYDSLLEIVGRANEPLRDLLIAREQAAIRERRQLTDQLNREEELTADLRRLGNQRQRKLEKTKGTIRRHEQAIIKAEESIRALQKQNHRGTLAACATVVEKKGARQKGKLVQAVANRQLEILVSQPQTTLRMWRNTGRSPKFALRWTGSNPLPAGWYTLELYMQPNLDEPAPPKLYLDYGNGFTKHDAIRLPLAQGSLHHRVLLFFRSQVHDACIRPHARSEIKNTFVFDTSLYLRRISKAEAMLRLGVPAVRKARALGVGWSTVVRESMRMLGRGTTSAMQQLHTNAEPATDSESLNYAQWVAAHGSLDDAARRNIKDDIARMRMPPTISVILPVYNTPERWLRHCIDSVRAQLYPHWELCIADDASPGAHVRQILDSYASDDERIKVIYRSENGHISAASNSALQLATADWVALLDHDDELSEHALYHVAKAIIAHPKARLLYSDEDKINAEGTRFDPYFKPDWNPELFLSQNMITHLGVYHRELMNSTGGFREGFEGSQDHDLALRCAEQIQSDTIHHIPRVLYHWRAIQGSTATAPSKKNYAHDAGLRAIREHLERRCIKAEVSRCAQHYYRTRYALPSSPPKVTVIVPTRDRADLLQMSVGSMLKVTDYPDFEILIVDNQSMEQGTLDWFDMITAMDDRVRILPHHKPFNFARINNEAVATCDSDIVVLVNNDIQATHADWLTEMTSHAIRDRVGAVGAKLYYPDGTIQHAGVILGIGGVAGHAWCHKPHDYPGQMSRAMLVQNVSAVTGACLAVRTSAYMEVGGMNEELEVAFNDIDFCLRLLKSGYRNVWTPHAELVHHESASRGYEDTPEKLARFNAEIRKMQSIWTEMLCNDPAYNPNLTLSGEPFTIARNPRVRATDRESTP